MTPLTQYQPEPNRRDVRLTGAAALAAALLPRIAFAQPQPEFKGNQEMSTFTTTDGTETFYKDWGPRDVQPIFFHHGGSAVGRR